MMRLTIRTTGLAIVSGWVLVAALAPALGPHPPALVHRDHQLSPPTVVRVVHEGRLHAPFFYTRRLVNPLERAYVEDRRQPIPLVFLSRGHLVTSADARHPFLPLGADASGRDVLSRVLAGARVSLGIAVAAALAATLLGLCVGAAAGYFGGPADLGLMRVAEFVAVLPALYLLLALRTALPLVLPPFTTTVVTITLFGLLGWPHVARGVRNLVAAERQQDFVAAALALGATAPRVIAVHLVPACKGFLATQFVLLVPAFVMAEATLSFAGLGFVDPVPSWGTMLQEAANVSVLSTAPWVLAPAVAIFSVVLGLNLLVRGDRTRPVAERHSQPGALEARLA